MSGFNRDFSFYLAFVLFRKDLFRKRNPRRTITYSENRVLRIISTNLFVIGFTSTSVQILLMREIMNISGGYELITGVFLGSWLIASALGAAIAGRSKLNDIRKINMVFSLSPFISFSIADTFIKAISGIRRNSILSVKHDSDFPDACTILPCFRICLCKTDFNSQEHGIGYVPGKSFSIETTGGIIAGILLSVLTSGMLNTWQLLIVILLLCFCLYPAHFLCYRQTKNIIVKGDFCSACFAGFDFQIRTSICDSCLCRESK